MPRKAKPKPGTPEYAAMRSRNGRNKHPPISLRVPAAERQMFDMLAERLDTPKVVLFQQLIRFGHADFGRFEKFVNIANPIATGR